ncbi:CynX/NimT family MFS transporter [Lentibacillus sp. Marseille-P4043]|uniref:CynX/NimT family MFS transporter n=1 Tax=Lentibacillus sp. Marseille-P4043 TaxID=2040293 RepID=UPI000D0B20B9|nr:MFS transporter [Lentibacillus sp. Marseille-P4043]
MTLDIQQRKTKEQGAFLLLAAILLFAANLRAPLTSVGSLVPTIRDSLGVSNAAIGIITTLPLLAFAFISPFAPKIANRFGMEKTIFLSMIILFIGMIIRSITGVGTLFVGTALIGIAIAFGNVLLPGFIKMSFPLKIGIITGLYTVVMNIFGGLASGFSVPLSNIGGFGWQGALGAWAILVIIALILWFPQLHHSTETSTSDSTKKSKKTNMWTSFTAWQVTIFMGFQSLMFYTPMTWLPEILQANGYSPSEAGWMLSLMQFSLIPTTFVMPIIADKMNKQKVLGALTGIIFILGVLGLLSGHPSLIIISVIMIGVGCGSGFSLSMMFFTLRTKDGYDASELSGMAQSFGYLLAALGPVLFGSLHDLTGSWTAPLFLLLIISIFVLITGWLSGRQVTIK